MSVLPSFGEFGLVGMDVAARTEDERWFSLPKVMLNRLPRIELKKQFGDSSAPLIDGLLMPFIVDGWFDFRLFAIWAKRGTAKLDAVNGVGDPEIVPLCIAALDCLGEYRAFACKRFYGVLREFAQFDDPNLYFAYLPCLGLLSIELVNLNFNKCLSTSIRESGEVLKADRDAIERELDKMAGLAAIMISQNQSRFIPDERVGSISAIQIKAWSSSLLRMSKVFLPEGARLTESANVGAAKLLDTAKTLNNTVAQSLRKIRKTKDVVPPLVAVDSYIETEPGPDCVEVLDDDELDTPATPDAAQEINSSQPKPIFVVDLAALKGDSALVKLCQEHWHPVKLARLASAMKTKELFPEVFESIADENPHAEAPLLAVARSLRLHAQYGRKSLTFKPLLFVGEAGTGKSYTARRVAAACDLPCLFLPLAGMSDSREIVGTPRGWSTTGPSIARILGEGFANPFIIFDEIDKCGTSNHNGNALSAMLPLLEKSTAEVWYDPFFGCAIDCSMINIIATANTLTGLPAPLLSRFQVFHIRPPEKAHYPKIIASVVGEVAADLGIHPGLLPALDGEDIEFLTANCRDIRTLSLTVRRVLEHRAAEAHSGVLH